MFWNCDFFIISIMILCFNFECIVSVSVNSVLGKFM